MKTPAPYKYVHQFRPRVMGIAPASFHPRRLGCRGFLCRRVLSCHVKQRPWGLYCPCTEPKRPKSFNKSRMRVLGFATASFQLRRPGLQGLAVQVGVQTSRGGPASGAYPPPTSPLNATQKAYFISNNIGTVILKLLNLIKHVKESKKIPSSRLSQP